jgi:hypothetical protein
VPFRYSVTDDTKFYLMLIKGIIDNGWVFTIMFSALRSASSCLTTPRARTT